MVRCDASLHDTTTLGLDDHHLSFVHLNMGVGLVMDFLRRYFLEKGVAGAVPFAVVTISSETRSTPSPQPDILI
jgi:hypothetical protein